MFFSIVFTVVLLNLCLACILFYSLITQKRTIRDKDNTIRALSEELLKRGDPLSSEPVSFIDGMVEKVVSDTDGRRSESYTVTSKVPPINTVEEAKVFLENVLSQSEDPRIMIPYGHVMKTDQYRAIRTLMNFVLQRVETISKGG